MAINYSTDVLLILILNPKLKLAIKLQLNPKISS